MISFLSAHAYEQIPITLSSTIDKVQLDGKWSFETEWKQTSLNNYYFDNGNTLIILRSAHHGDYVYVLIDAINDEIINKGEDQATICFDTHNDKTQTPNNDDYCFDAILGMGMGNTYRGNYADLNGGFIEIPNHLEFVGLSTDSDKNDRYSGVQHPAYEFRIPTDVIGRNSVYGFYFEVYDGDTKKLYTYPENQTSMMKSPVSWGEIYSPDKSLPEFYLPFLVTISSFTFIIIVSRSKLSLTL